MVAGELQFLIAVGVYVPELLLYFKGQTTAPFALKDFPFFKLDALFIEATIDVEVCITSTACTSTRQSRLLTSAPTDWLDTVLAPSVSDYTTAGTVCCPAAAAQLMTQLS